MRPFLYIDGCRMLLSHMHDLGHDRARFKQIYAVALSRIEVGNMIVVSRMGSLVIVRGLMMIVQVLRSCYNF